MIFDLDNYILIDLYYITKENLIFDALCLWLLKMDFKKDIGFKKDI